MKSINSILRFRTKLWACDWSGQNDQTDLILRWYKPKLNFKFINNTAWATKENVEKHLLTLRQTKAIAKSIWKQKILSEVVTWFKSSGALLLVATSTVPVLNNLLTIPDKATIANTSTVCRNNSHQS